MRQFVTCSAESYILVWDLKRPPSEMVPKQATLAADSDDDDVFEDADEEEKPKKEEEPQTKGWAALKSKKMLTSYVFSKDKKWTPAVGKYVLFKIIILKHDFML